MSYHQFKDPETGVSFGSFEVFHISADQIRKNDPPGYVFEQGAAGWYWWACFPGCLPDGEPHGPFPTEQDAINDAKEKP